MAWWQVASIIGEAAATIVLAGFAAVQIWREGSRTAERARTADARISTNAFLLRRQLRSWLGIEPPRDRGLEEWLRDARTLQTFGTELDIAERRIVESLATAGDASPAVAVRLREAFVLFLAGTNRLNE